MELNISEVRKKKVWVKRKELKRSERTLKNVSCLSQSVFGLKTNDKSWRPVVSDGAKTFLLKLVFTQGWWALPTYHVVIGFSSSPLLFQCPLVMIWFTSVCFGPLKGKKKHFNSFRFSWLYLFMRLYLASLIFSFSFGVDLKPPSVHRLSVFSVFTLVAEEILHKV